MKGIVSRLAHNNYYDVRYVTVRCVSAIFNTLYAMLCMLE